MSKHGKVFLMPTNIIEAMPDSDLCLDGEFWYFYDVAPCLLILNRRFGHGKLGEAMKISSQVSFEKINWGKFQCILFLISVVHP